MHSAPEDSNFSWLAPEIRSPNGKAVLTTESDIYSFGMVVIEVCLLLSLTFTENIETIEKYLQIVTGDLPYACHSDKYERLTDLKFIKLINEGVLPVRPQNPIVDDQMWALLNRCWSLDPEGRPKVPEIVEFLASYAST